MTVSYYYRTPTDLKSIERVFDSIRDGMPSEVVARSVYCPRRRGALGYLYNMVYSRSRQSDINHITGDVHYLAIALNPRRTVLTIHDCGTLYRLSGWRRELARLFWFEWPVRRATAITVISQQTKSDLMQFTSCRESAITVIPNPLPIGYSPLPKPFCKASPEILQIGTRENKNLENVIRALSGLSCRLTIVGDLSAAQSSLLESAKINHSVFSDITDAQMLGRYRAADIVIFCSTYEGFGMPIIEGNGIGRPVVTSDIEPLRSTAGNAACLVNPHEPESIRAGIVRVIEDDAYRGELVARGFLNAARFEAREIAKQHLALYRRVLAA